MSNLRKAALMALESASDEWIETDPDRAGPLARGVSPLVDRQEDRRMPSFDTEAFMKKLHRAAAARGKTMKEVAAETGVSQTTLSRMSTGRRVCDAASLAALSAWAGINPAKFSGWVPPHPVHDDKTASTRLRANAELSGAAPLGAHTGSER